MSFEHSALFSVHTLPQSLYSNHFSEIYISILSCCLSALNVFFQSYLQYTIAVFYRIAYLIPQDWKPLPDIPGSPEILSNTPVHPLSSPQQPPQGPVVYTPVKSRLPDPFAELTTDAQALVQSMAEMGFPRPRVARAVQKLGTDHKKVSELCKYVMSKVTKHSCSLHAMR